MTPAENLVSKLDKVKRTGQDRWQARCPAHEDKRPSLSIREAVDLGLADETSAIIRQLHAEGLIDGWRSVARCTLLEPGHD